MTGSEKSSTTAGPLTDHTLGSGVETRIWNAEAFLRLVEEEGATVGQSGESRTDATKGTAFIRERGKGYYPHPLQMKRERASIWFQTRDYHCVTGFSFERIDAIWAPSNERDNYAFFGSNAEDCGDRGRRTILKRMNGSIYQANVANAKMFRCYGFEVIDGGK